MSRLSDTIIQEAIEAIESGRSVEDVLARYSGQEADLRPILETAVQLSQMRVAHSLHAQEQSRARMLAAAEEMRSAIEPGSNRQRHLPRLVFGLAGLVIILLILSYGLVTTSSSAVPGDALYAPKQFIETIRLSLEKDPAQRGSLEAQFARERVREVAQLLDQGRQADVTFGGMINSIDGNQWIVAGLPVSLDASTQIIGRPENGAYADIKGETRGKVVSASIIEIRSTGTIEPDVTEPTPTVDVPALDGTPVVTTTTPATPTPSSTPTATSEPTSTPAPSPSSENILPQSEATIDIDDGTEEPGGGSDDSGDDDPDDGEHDGEEEEEEHGESSDNSDSDDGSDDSESHDEKGEEEKGDQETTVQLTTK